MIYRNIGYHVQGEAPDRNGLMGDGLRLELNTFRCYRCDVRKGKKGRKLIASRYVCASCIRGMPGECDYRDKDKAKKAKEKKISNKARPSPRLPASERRIRESEIETRAVTLALMKWR